MVNAHNQEGHSYDKTNSGLNDGEKIPTRTKIPGVKHIDRVPYFSLVTKKIF